MCGLYRAASVKKPVQGVWLGSSWTSDFAFGVVPELVTSTGLDSADKSPSELSIRSVQPSSARHWNQAGSYCRPPRKHHDCMIAGDVVGAATVVRASIKRDVNSSRVGETDGLVRRLSMCSAADAPIR